MTQNKEEAVKWYRQAAAQGDAQAQYNLAVAYDEGEGVTQNKEEAVKWYRQAAAQGIAQAQYNLAVAYDEGEGVTQNKEEAVKWWRQAAAQGIAQAQYNLAVAYSTGEGVTQNKEEAVKWWRQAAAQGIAKAQYNLAVAYSTGEGVTQNKEEAVKWYRQAAAQGDAEAQYNLALAYSTGEGVTQNKEEAVKWWRQAAAQGDAEAQYNLAVAYDEGEGVTQNKEEAVKWCKQAAAQGHAKAQCNLAVAYSTGEGVTQNKEEAVKWYRHAAVQGIAKAQYNLAVAYSTGEGVTQNKEEAVKWFRQAAAQGDAQAQYNLAITYSTGEGVTQNFEEASYWLDKAAAANYPLAVTTKNPSLATLKAAVSSPQDHWEYLFRYGFKKFGLVFLKQKNNQLEFTQNSNVGMSKKQLGEGHFCRVFEGTLNGTTIAAKYIKVLSDLPDGVPDIEEKRTRSKQLTQYQKKLLQYIEEIELTLQVPAHDNIITTFGFCANPFILLQEKAMTSLKKYIEDIVAQDRTVSLVWLVGCVLMICQGMQHLHQQGIVHRDLALRNTLLMADGTVKIGDFGLSKTISDLNASTARETKREEKQPEEEGATEKQGNYAYIGEEYLAVRWMAPEVLQSYTKHEGRKGIYSQEADVWSFGVVIYEVFSGDTPYREWRHVEDVRRLVCKAVDPMRLEDRDGPCPYTLYQLQQQCFSSREKRPSFAQMTGEILDILDKTESNEKQVQIGKFYAPSELGEDPREDDNAEWESEEEA